MISVIVPIYNVEAYLEPCLKSIVNQTYKDIEILCIDDCTLDNSVNIVKKFMQLDKRIRLINHSENRGLGGARNTGIQEAKGEYISFVDSDDVLDLTMLEKMHKAIISYNVEAVVCGIRRFHEKTELAKFSTLHYLPNPKSRVMYIGEHKERLCDIWPSAPNKLYKTSIIRDYQCRFPEKLLYEDHFFFYNYFDHVNAFYFINEPLYSYRADREGSITSTITGRESEVFSVLTDLKQVFINSFSKSAWEKSYAKICFRLIWERHNLLWNNFSEWKKFVKQSELWLLKNFDRTLLAQCVDTSIATTDAFYRYMFTSGINRTLFRLKLKLKGKSVVVALHTLYSRIKAYRSTRSYIRELIWLGWQNREKLQELSFPVWYVHDTYFKANAEESGTSNEGSDL